MGYTAAPLEKLIEQFSQFPGIGRKGATRMAYQVLSMSDADAAALAEAIQNAHTRLHRCRVCQNYTEAELCPICSSAKRDRSTICVVETPRPRIGPLPCWQCHTALSWRQKTANSEAAPRWREASDTLPLNRESDHTGTSEYRIAKFSVIGEE